MWPIVILLSLAGFWVAKRARADEVKPVDVAPKPAAVKVTPGKVKLHLVKALKKAAAYVSPNAAVETIALGPNQTIAPLLDPAKLDEQAAQLRMTGGIVEADRLSKLANQVRASIVAKYNTDPKFAAKVDAAGAAKRKG